jgi:trehalose 6-phosphate synthase
MSTILAQDVDDPGVLILSMFSGAAEQLSEAIIVNPYDANETSYALHSALSMPLHERKRRHGLMLKKVLRYDSLWWGRTFIEALEDKTRPAAPVFRTSHYGVFTPQKLY